MSEHEVQRTLVKSPPELWAEVSDPESLGRRLAALGEITVTRTEPETTVAWEGEKVSGTVVLEASGWGTKVTFEATLDEPEPAPEPEPGPEPDDEPAAAAEPAPEPAAPATGFFARLFSPRVPEPAVPEPPETVAPVPAPVKPPEVEPQVAAEPAQAEEPALDSAALEAALDDLGATHHRHFSRS